MTTDIRRVTLAFENGTIVSFLEDLAIYDLPVEKTVFTAPLDVENGDGLAQEMTWRYVHDETHPARSAMRSSDPITITITRVQEKVAVPGLTDTGEERMYASKRHHPVGKDVEPYPVRAADIENHDVILTDVDEEPRDVQLVDREIDGRPPLAGVKYPFVR